MSVLARLLPGQAISKYKGGERSKNASMYNVLVQVQAQVQEQGNLKVQGRREVKSWGKMQACTMYYMYTIKVSQMRRLLTSSRPSVAESLMLLLSLMLVSLRAGTD